MLSAGEHDGAAWRSSPTHAWGSLAHAPTRRMLPYVSYCPIIRVLEGPYGSDGLSTTSRSKPTHMQQRQAMRRRMFLSLVCLVLAGTPTTGTPTLVGPTASAGYFFTLKVSPATILLGVYDSSAALHYPTRASVVVRVQDGQGRPVDGVAVAFELEPAWSSETVTHGGVARTIFSAPRTTGRVRITARVDNTTARAALVVQSYEERPEQD